MSDEPVEADLLAAIAADPDAIEPRLIYADWLQAQNDPRGELVIVQARRVDNPDDVELQERERELTTALTKALMDQTASAPLPPQLIASWHLGFVDALKLSVRAIRQLRTTHRAWFAQPQFACVREIDVESKFARNLRFVRDTPLGKTVRRLRYGDMTMAINAPTFDAIVNKLPKLTSLHLRALDAPELDVLSKLPLGDLSLELYELSRDGIMRLCEMKWQLERFALKTLRPIDEELLPLLGSLYDGTVLTTVNHYLVDGAVPAMDIIETLATSRRALTVESFTADFQRLNYDTQLRAERHRDVLAKVAFKPVLGSTTWSDAENCVSVGSFLNYRLERPADAVAHYEHALRINSNHYSARQNLAHAFRKLKRYEESLVHFDLCISQSRNPAASLFNDRHYTLCELGRRDEARADLERAVQIDPNFSGAWNNLGCERRYMGDAEGALAAFRRCMEVNPEHGYGRRNEADLLLELGLAGEALPIYLDLVRTRSTDVWARGMLPYAQFEAGNAAAALPTIDARLADPSEQSRIRLYILRALVNDDLGDPAAARNDLDRAANETDCPGWFALVVYARALGARAAAPSGDATTWTRAIPDMAITPNELGHAFLAHAAATRAGDATRMHDPTTDDRVDFAEVAIAAALFANNRELAIARIRAMCTFISEQGPRFFRYWWPTFASAIHVTNRSLDKRDRELLRKMMRATRGRERIGDLLATVQ